MFLVSWRGFKKVTTISCPSSEEVFDVVSLLEDAKTKYKVTDRTGLIPPRYLGYGDMYYWQLNPADPLD
jgi:hypothetical protein